MKHQISPPKPNTQFFKHRSRLALYHPHSKHDKYWAEYWTPELYQRYERELLAGRMDEFERYGPKYLKKHDAILEAGCGNGMIVDGMHRRGYTSVLGVDYDSNAISQIRTHRPHLNVREGNVLALDMPSHSLDAYLSFGVVEHFENGPEPILREAARVLKPGGIAMISVPHLNALRSQYLSTAEPAPVASSNNPLSFHQYYFSIDEFKSILSTTGFEVKAMYPYGASAFLLREHLGFKRVWNSPILPNPAKYLVRKWLYRAPMSIRLRYAHMNMFICHLRNNA